MTPLRDHPTIFIAEDNPTLLHGLGLALSGNGYRVESVGDGAAMLDLLRSRHELPDLVLLDVMMPRMTGLDVLHTIKRDPRLLPLPVFLITAATDHAFVATAIRSGAVDVLIKPFRLGELIARIDAHVRCHRELRQLRSMVSHTASPASATAAG